MADDTEKSELPTPRRRQEARSRGQIPKSQDLTAAVLLLVGLLTLALFGESVLGRLFTMTTFLLGGGGDDEIHAGPGDRVDGGPGRDILLLPEALRAAPVTWQDGRLAIGAGAALLLLAGVEEIAYGEGPPIATETLP